jgi:mRNA-degrading endonuclease RelE of RelBE toxin-antitoxin system
MSFKVRSAPPFLKKAKRLAKKYKSIRDDLKPILDELPENPPLGESIGKNCYKIRVAVKSKNKGKSGGARMITCVYFVTETVYLLTIYDKSEQDTISDEDLQELLNTIVDTDDENDQAETTAN